MKAPFPWFGGKSRAAALVWAALGPVENYVEPFAGSLAVLLARDAWPKTAPVETVNDLDCFVANFWRAVALAPDVVARYATGPVNEADLHARHAWLKNRDWFREEMMSDPLFCDVKIAGWWAWGLCAWIGDGWMSSSSRSLPELYGAGGRGLHRKTLKEGEAAEWLRALCDRLKRVRVACGDWQRVLTKTPLAVSPPSGGGIGNGFRGVFLDPPYPEGNMGYATRGDVSRDVYAWAIEHGGDPHLRIVLAGYEGLHMPPDWRSVAWKAKGGYGSQGNGQARLNSFRERLFMSPGCLVLDVDAVGARDGGGT